MPRESRKKQAERAREIVRRLREVYPEAKTALRFQGPLQMLAATILSAQCTDEKVNEVTPELFRRYRTAQDFAAADSAELEALIRPTGFFRNKTKSLIGVGEALVERFGGEVPREMEALISLPGVARKTANVVQQNSWGIVEGIVVDTHVQRLAQRMGLTGESDPQKIERELRELLPREDWQFVGHGLILHGRQICTARKPRCGECPVEDLCPKVGVEGRKEVKR